MLYNTEIKLELSVEKSAYETFDYRHIGSC